VEHPPEAEQVENICPNMTNKEFCNLVLGLRDVAVGLVEQRLKDLDVWGKPERERAARWFGVSDEALRQYLKTGFQQTLKVLKGLTGDNFVRYSPQLMRNLGCTPSGNKSGLAAEVVAQTQKRGPLASPLTSVRSPTNLSESTQKWGRSFTRRPILMTLSPPKIRSIK
jgi:hypothetical protein